MAVAKSQVVTEEWVTFPGGELEGKRPKALCRGLPRGAEARSGRRPGLPAAARLLCFHCYRADLARARALKAAGELDTASEARFQTQLPFEPVNHARLDMLKAERAEARAAASQGIGQYADKRRQAQIQARHALQAIAAGLQRASAAHRPAPRRRSMAAAIHAAELQLPEAWLPFVCRR